MDAFFVIDILDKPSNLVFGIHKATVFSVKD